jgi:cysteinyl-tRNA synthetase
MSLQLYNTLTKKKENFKPLGNTIKIYTCGPTVYSFQHIGNMRSFLLADFLIKILKYNQFKVKHVINYTDVGHLTSDSDHGEDKMEKAAEKEGLLAQEIAKKYINSFESDIIKLNIEFGKRVKASEHIDQQISLIQKLEKEGFTYKTSDGIYFNTKKFKTYGVLSGFGKIKRKAGVRIALKEKKNSTDFALWKFSPEKEKRQQEWSSPWGTGFPGWHIECSAMSTYYLGKHFDIHTGGQDLSQVHHNNEIAQSEAATGKKFVNYWIHGGFLTFDNKKVSKSTGGLYTVSELEKENFSALHLRYLTLLTHYRKPLNFTLENLEAAKSAYEKIRRKIIETKSQIHKGKDLTKLYENQFKKAINKDLNLPQAVQIFLKALDDFNFDPKKKLSLLKKFDTVLGLQIVHMNKAHEKIPKEIKELIKQREKLRKEKNFEKADLLRKKIKEKGYLIEDTPNGMEIEKTTSTL